jgi:hypothetical protein
MNPTNGYQLSRGWFDFCFENPEKISPSHTAIYFFAIEHCNRLGWKNKFGFPTQMTMDALGIKKHQTYIKYFNDLVDWGFFKLIQKSKNQYSANIISLQVALPKNGKALDKAFITHAAKQTEPNGQSTGQSKDSIDKPITNNQEPINQEQDAPTLEEIKESLFGESEQRWVDEMTRLYGKWGPTEFDKCYQYHVNTASPPAALWQWRQKFGTWLSIKKDRAADKEIKPPEPYDKFSEAEYNKTLWSLEGWEKHYQWRLNNEADFRKHFGYGELQKGTPVGGRNNGRGGLKGTSGP